MEDTIQNCYSIVKKKKDYIKSTIKSRVPENSNVEFEYIWNE